MTTGEFCTNCGAAVADDAVFCTSCGEEVTHDEVAAGRRWPVIVISLAVLVAAGTAGWLVFGGGEESASDEVALQLPDDPQEPDDEAPAAVDEVTTSTEPAPETTASINTTAPPTTTTTTTTATTTTTRPAPTVVDAAGIVASASSTLPDWEDVTYDASNTLDGDITTAWNDDTGDESTGVGEVLAYTFAQPVDLASIRIINGYAKSTEVFIRNESVKTALIATDTGVSETVTLDDVSTPQSIAFDHAGVSIVTITIVEIHPGRVFNGGEAWTDLAVTEVTFFGYQ